MVVDAIEPPAADAPPVAVVRPASDDVTPEVPLELPPAALIVVSPSDPPSCVVLVAVDPLLLEPDGEPLPVEQALMEATATSSDRRVPPVRSRRGLSIGAQITPGGLDSAIATHGD